MMKDLWFPQESRDAVMISQALAVQKEPSNLTSSSRAASIAQ